MELKTIKIPNKILRQKAQVLDLAEVGKPEFQEFLDKFIITMKTEDGIGLAAPQVGIGQRFFAVAMENGAQIFINPKILFRSWLKEIDEEGCLSVPEVFGLVKRPKTIIVQAFDRQGKKFTMKAKGLAARVIQHEYDHLNGVLFIDKVKKITQGQEKLTVMLNEK